MAKRGLPPILPRSIRVLILGSLPSDASIAKQQYYGHPQNHFWRVLEAWGAVESAEAPYAKRVHDLKARGIAVWDLYAAAERDGSGDEKIRDPIPNAITALWKEKGPFPILLNGRRRGEWRRHFGDLPAEPIALPSTSPRPLHWNTPADRAAAVSEWHRALRAALGTAKRRRRSVTAAGC